MRTTTSPFTVETRPGAIILKVHVPHLSFGEIEGFGQQLMLLVDQSAGAKLAVDLSGVGMISSVVIGRLFQARKALLNSGRELVITANTPAVLNTFQVCRLDRITRVCQSLEEALGS